MFCIFLQIFITSLSIKCIIFITKIEIQAVEKYGLMNGDGNRVYMSYNKYLQQKADIPLYLATAEAHQIGNLKAELSDRGNTIAQKIKKSSADLTDFYEGAEVSSTRAKFIAASLLKTIAISVFVKFIGDLAGGYGAFDGDEDSFFAAKADQVLQNQLVEQAFSPDYQHMKIALNDIKRRFPDVKIELTENYDTLSDTEKEYYNGKNYNSGINGYYNGKTDTVIIFADNVKNSSQLEKTFCHETSGHKGLQVLLGNEYTSIIDEIYSAVNQKHSADLQELAATYGQDLNTIEGQRYVIEEYLANQADLNKVSGIKAFIQKIKLALRKVGFRAKWTDDEIATLMRRSLANQQGKKSGTEGNGNVRFMSEPFTEQQKKDLLQQARNSGLKNTDVIEKMLYGGSLTINGNTVNFDGKNSHALKLHLEVQGFNPSKGPVTFAEIQKYLPEALKQKPNVETKKNRRGKKQQNKIYKHTENGVIYTLVTGNRGDFKSFYSDKKIDNKRRKFAQSRASATRMLSDDTLSQLPEKSSENSEKIRNSVAPQTAPVIEAEKKYKNPDDDPRMIELEQQKQEALKDTLNAVNENGQRFDDINGEDEWAEMSEEERIEEIEGSYDSAMGDLWQEIEEEQQFSREDAESLISQAYDATVQYAEQLGYTVKANDVSRKSLSTYITVNNGSEDFKIRISDHWNINRSGVEHFGNNDVDVIVQNDKIDLSDVWQFLEENALDNGNVSFSVAPQVDTPEFKNWFKDSKVVDENGKPLVVYHGTNWDMLSETPGNAVFDDKYRGVGSGDNGFFGRGFYFTFGNGKASEGEAGFYGRNVYKFYLSIQKPFYFSENLLSWNGKKVYGDDIKSVEILNAVELFPELLKDFTLDTYDKNGDYSGSITLTEYAKLFKDVYNNKKFNIRKSTMPDEIVIEADPVKYSEDGYTWVEYGFSVRMYSLGKNVDMQLLSTHLYLQDSMNIDIPHNFLREFYGEPEFRQWLENNGYDGVMQSKNGDEVVAFYPNQIKSATDNVGTFDKNNPDIRFSVAPQVEKREAQGNPKKYFPFREKIGIKKRKSVANLFAGLIFIFLYIFSG